MTWGIWQILTRTLESVETGTFMGYVCPKQKMHKLKIYIYMLTLNNDEKFEEELTCRLKIRMENVTNCDPSTGKSQTFALSWDAFDWPKYIVFKLKKIQRSYAWLQWRLMQNLEEKLLVL